MDYIYATIIVALIFAAVVKLASWKREHKRLNGIITDARNRCGHEWPELDKWDMSRVYRDTVTNSKPLDPDAAEVLRRNMWDLM